QFLIVGDVRVARPGLLAVDDQPVAVDHGFGLHARQIRAGVRLGEALAPDLFAAQDRREVALLLLLGAVRHQRRAGVVEPAEQGAGFRRTGANRFLDPDRLHRRRQAAAPVLDRPTEAGEAAVELGALPFEVELAGGRTVVRPRLCRHVLGEPRARALAEVAF